MVEFNTANIPDYKYNIEMNPDNTDGSRKNLLSLLPINWFMFTFVFQDNYSLISANENGIKVMFYINDMMYDSISASTDPHLRNNRLVQNDGNLNLLPNLKNVGVKNGKGH